MPGAGGGASKVPIVHCYQAGSVPEPEGSGLSHSAEDRKSSAVQTGSDPRGGGPPEEALVLPQPVPQKAGLASARHGGLLCHPTPTAGRGKASQHCVDKTLGLSPKTT